MKREGRNLFFDAAQHQTYAVTVFHDKITDNVKPDVKQAKVLFEKSTEHIKSDMYGLS